MIEKLSRDKSRQSLLAAGRAVRRTVATRNRQSSTVARFDAVVTETMGRNIAGAIFFVESVVIRIRDGDRGFSLFVKKLTSWHCNLLKTETGNPGSSTHGAQALYLSAESTMKFDSMDKHETQMRDCFVNLKEEIKKCENLLFSAAAIERNENNCTRQHSVGHTLHVELKKNQNQNRTTIGVSCLR